MNNPTTRGAFLRHLDYRRRLERSKYGRADAYFGWVNTAAMAPGGETQVPYQASLGVAEFSETLYQKIFAHELGHVFAHLQEGDPGDKIDPDVGWDSLNLLNLGLAKPKSNFDVMVQRTHGAKYSNSWVHRDTYEDMREARTWGTVVTTTSDPPVLQPTTVMTITRTGVPPTWSFGPFAFEVTTLPAPLEPEAGGPGLIRILDAGGGELYATTFSDAPSESGPVDDLPIEVPTFAAAATIEVYWNGNLHDVLRKSANFPEVSLTNPQPGDTLDENTVIEWEATDADGDPLTAIILYSHNNGQSERVLGMFLEASGSLALDSQGLPAALHQAGSIRVAVSDGLNTSSAEVSDLLLGSNHGPSVEIVQPKGGEIFKEQGGLILWGYVYDLEDGWLEDDVVEWRSDLDGLLGTGRVLNPVLSPGAHTLTLEATDSEGAEATDSVSVVIQ